MVRPRLVIVQQCVEDLWESRNDGSGRFEVLERTLIDILAPKKKAQVSRSQTPPTLQAPSNVIHFAERAARMRRASSVDARGVEA